MRTSGASAATQRSAEHYAWSERAPQSPATHIRTEACSLREEATVLFMVIEHFKDGDAAPIYRRFRAQGRMLPDGLRYVASWTTTDLTRCFQLMECADARLFDEWLARWQDL